MRNEGHTLRACGFPREFHLCQSLFFFFALFWWRGPKRRLRPGGGLIPSLAAWDRSTKERDCGRGRGWVITDSEVSE